MPNYNITQCLTNEQYVVSATTLTFGDVIGFYIGENSYCGVVNDETTNPITPLSLYFNTYTTCCKCLGAITDSLNFRFISCDTLEQIDIDANDFCNQYGAPLTGETYKIQYLSNTPFCATFQELSPTGETGYSYVSGPFNDCDDCYEPLTAGTPYEVCVICCPCESGQTITSKSVPHPVWTNQYGKAVIQASAVQLGGPNGLYS